MAILQLCTSQAENNAAYVFRATNTKVFSLEETLFHVYYNWKNTTDELFAPPYINWVRRDLKLPDIADKLHAYSALSFKDKLISYLRVIDYFEDIEINSLIKELDAWEKRVEWERLKDRGDYLTMHGMPDKAVSVYKKALKDGRRVRLMNNLAVALMQLERYTESADLLYEAMNKEPANNELKLNYAEACIYSGKINEARAALEELPQSESVFRLFGELYIRAGDTSNALKSFKSAAESGGSAEYIYRLADFYIGNAEYDNALSVINRIKMPDAKTALKRAQIHKAQSDFAAASNVLEKSLLIWPNDAELWLELSECCRAVSNSERANQAVLIAMSLQPDNTRIKLEAIKVKRDQNNVREYQEALRQLISSLINDYRENEEAI